MEYKVGRAANDTHIKYVIRCLMCILMWHWITCIPCMMYPVRCTAYDCYLPCTYGAWCFAYLNTAYEVHAWHISSWGMKYMHTAYDAHVNSVWCTCVQHTIYMCTGFKNNYLGNWKPPCLTLQGNRELSLSSCCKVGFMIESCTVLWENKLYTV